MSVDRRGGAAGRRPRGGRATRRRRFGQHFLEPAWVARVVRAIAPAPEDVCLEIGPGRGALTRALAPHVARLIAVEIDRDLAKTLDAQAIPSLTVVTADFLDVDVDPLLPPGPPVRVVGNLPYGVATPILLRLLRLAGDGARLRDAVLMLQREVAERVVARPGGRDWGPLAIATQLAAEASLVLNVPRGAFRPMPAVTSAVVRLRFRPAEIEWTRHRWFDPMVRVMFTQRRKTVLNATRPWIRSVTRLPAEEVFARAGVDPGARPAQLGLSELADLVEVLATDAS